MFSATGTVYRSSELSMSSGQMNEFHWLMNV